LLSPPEPPRSLHARKPQPTRQRHVVRLGGFSEITGFLWSVADLLRGNYKQADYGKVILPFTVLRRLDCVLADSKEKVLAKHEELKKAKHPEGTVEKMLVRLTAVLEDFDAQHQTDVAAFVMHEVRSSNDSAVATENMPGRSRA
jgi:type I restriction enzyme M protein